MRQRGRPPIQTEINRYKALEDRAERAREADPEASRNAAVDFGARGTPVIEQEAKMARRWTMAP